MSKEDLKYLVKVIILAALVIIAIRFFIYILPVLLIIFVIMFLYDGYVKRKKERNRIRVTEEENKIMDAEIINERKTN